MELAALRLRLEQLGLEVLNLQGLAQGTCLCGPVALMPRVIAYKCVGRANTGLRMGLWRYLLCVSASSGFTEAKRANSVSRVVA